MKTTIGRHDALTLIGAASLSLLAPFSAAEETAGWAQVTALTLVAYGKEDGGPKPASRQLSGPTLGLLNADLSKTDADKGAVLLEFLNQQLAMSGLPFTPLEQADLDKAHEGHGLTTGEVKLNVAIDSPVWAMRVDLLLE